MKSLRTTANSPTSSGNPPSVVLIVDDDDQDVMHARHYLREAGISGAVVNVGDADRAFVHLADCIIRRGDFPQLIIVNLQMKGGGGFELVEWICLQPDLQKALIVVVCSSTDEHEIAQAAALGARAFCSRSARLAEIRSAYQLVSAMRSVDELDRALQSNRLRPSPRRTRRSADPLLAAV